jgi:L,D-transpeptidase ErfK/SrfK
MIFTKKLSVLCVAAIVSALNPEASALTFPLPADGSTVMGATQTIRPIAGDTFSSIGRRYQVGIVELFEANPNLSIDKTYGPEQDVLIPTEFILPNAPHAGLVINLAEVRVYFYRPGTKTVMTFPVGIGRGGSDTPLGQTLVVAKITDPTWTPTAETREDHADDATPLPDQVKPGPDNPLGQYELRLGWPHYLMHGSNDASGIGRRSSSGCIRMQPEAIESIFKLVPKGLLVTTVDQPIKVGWKGNDFYIESHIPLESESNDDLLKQGHKVIDEAIAKRHAIIDGSLADQAIIEHLGYPIKIGSGTDAIPDIAVPLNPSAIVINKLPPTHPHKIAIAHKKRSKWAAFFHKKGKSS